MKTINSFFPVILLLIPLSSEARFSKYVGVGLTRATLRTEGGKSDWGKYIGLGLEYSNPFSLFLAAEAAYATKKVTLENKSWPTHSEIHNSGKSIGDIPIHGSFLELAAKIGYDIPIVRNQVSIKLFAGPILSLQLRYLGSFKEDTILWYDPEKGPYEFDYLRSDSEGDTNTSINATTGVVISYKAFGVETSYTRSFTKRNYMVDLSINDELDSFHILLWYAF